MKNMVGRLDKNGVVEDDNRPWGALVILVEKLHQENVPWNKYQWRLCVSYLKLNHITFQFFFLITHSDDSV